MGDDNPLPYIPLKNTGPLHQNPGDVISFKTQFSYCPSAEDSSSPGGLTNEDSDKRLRVEQAGVNYIEKSSSKLQLFKQPVSYNYIKLNSH